MKKVAILGSTGSIGTSTLEVIRRYPDRFQAVGLAARSSLGVLEKQVHLFKPSVVAVYDEEAAQALKKKGLSVDILSGVEGLVEIATMAEADVVVSAIVGSSGLVPTYEAVNAGKTVAIANKESLVMAGELIMETAKKTSASILPVDSEHSAVFQCLNGTGKDKIKRVILTASGGPFLSKSLEELEHVTVQAALNHPTWSMGKKISIDSATLMNKALEIIEARWLFDVKSDQIEVIIHPQSIVHSMVEFVDGSIIAQMSQPDMQGPICYAMSYPDRVDNVLPSLDLSSIGHLYFEEPDVKKYPSLALAYRCVSTGGTLSSVLNAANEVAVDAFLNQKIPFLSIYSVVAETMNAHNLQNGSNLESIINSSEWARKKAMEEIRRISL